MERNDYVNMSNSELRVLISTIENEFEAKKSKLLRLCEELQALQLKHKNVNNELSSRKNTF